MKLVLASKNQHKLAELRSILVAVMPAVELVSYDGPEPAETGVSFEENALIKARAAAQATGVAAIADDSGISVAAMGGSPGIFSARWAGPQRSDRDNLELLLWQMSDIANEHRAAAFECAAAFVTPDGDETVTLGLAGYAAAVTARRRRLRVRPRVSTRGPHSFSGGTRQRNEEFAFAPAPRLHAVSSADRAEARLLKTGGDRGDCSAKVGSIRS